MIRADTCEFEMSDRSSSEVSFYFYANTNDGGKIREALNRLVERRRLNKIALEPTHFTFQQKPALRLEVSIAASSQCNQKCLSESRE